jgi:uncharacterized RDD family membrane protein YckC
MKPLLERSAATGRAARARGRERIETLVDDALASPLPEAVARSSVEHHVGDRLAAELEPERERLVQQLLDSPEFERALETALSSPKVREALAHQTRSAAAELAVDVHRRAVGVDRTLSLARARDAVRFAGAASRGLAFAIDIVLAELVFLVGATVVGLVVSFVGTLRPAWLFGALAGSAWLLVVCAYFVFFWTLGGQTLGMRMLHVRVVDQDGHAPTFLRAVVRFAALVLAIIPMFAGLLPVLFDRSRRGLHDLVAGTTVVYVE